MQVPLNSELTVYVNYTSDINLRLGLLGLHFSTKPISVVKLISDLLCDMVSSQ